MHLPPLIQDLALILMTAAVMSLLFRKIRQPVVLGYIIAGFFVGPHIKWMPSVVDLDSVKVWAEMGVIFLLFALGLEFSFKKLVRVGPSAVVTALVEILGMVAIGYALGQLFEWSAMDSLFLGGILAISSTTIIIRAFDELGLKTSGFVRLVFGVLIVEDLVAILLMVVLATVAATQAFSGIQLGTSALRLAFFLILWFVLGIFLIPSFLKKVRPLMRPETLLLVSLGLCFLMVVFATKVGFSPALGAFIMGSILAETVDRERIEHLIQPVKDLFAAVFFVSVGMLIDPAILIKYAGPVLLITLATIVGKFITTAGGALMSGQSLRHSVQTGLSLAQIGEFSFIIAGLGLSLNVTSDFLYPIAICVSAISTFTTPYLIRSSDRVVHLLERWLPAHWLKTLETFRTRSADVSRTNDWRVLMKKAALKIGANGVVVIFLFLLVNQGFLPWLRNHIEHQEFSSILSLGLALVLSIPFLWGMAAGRLDETESALWQSKNYKAPLLVFETSRWIFTILLTAVLAARFVSAIKVLFVFAGILALATFFFYKRIGKVYRWFESRFVTNLSDQEVQKKERELPPIAPWDSHLAELAISADSPLIGQKLSETMIRERFGVSIALIERGRRIITAPGREDVLYPYDKIQVIGTDPQIAELRKICEPPELESAEQIPLDYALKSILIETNMPYANKSIRECGLREELKALVVGIEKSGKRTLNPDSSTIIEPGDVLWVLV